MTQKRCPKCAKTIAAEPCPHCLGAARLARARLVDLRDVCRECSSRLSARLSGMQEPQDAVANLWQAIKLIGETSRSLREKIEEGK